MHLKFKFRDSWVLPSVGVITVLSAIAITTIVAWVLYEHTVTLLTDNLRQRLLSISITQAANINPKSVDSLHVESDWKKPQWREVVSQLKKAKESNPNIVFMYVFRKKQNDPTQMEFVADAESINPYANTDKDPSNDVDANGDGKVEPDGPDQLQWPGQDYPSPPEETFEAYDGPLTSKDLYSDSYGEVLTGYAPIKDNNGNVAAILGVDIRANDFFTVTRQTLYPFMLFIVFLGLSIAALSLGLIRIWGSRVKFLRDLDEQKNHIIDTVAHQLNTPITAIRWASELMRDETQTVQESADQIDGGLKLLQELSEMFLQASHIRKGKLEINKQPADLNELFSVLTSQISILAKKKNIEFNVSMPKSLPVAQLDKKYTRISIENLLTNAVKYTPKGGRVDFEISVNNNVLYCLVKDNGVGIPKKDQDKVFGQMYRASNVSKPASEGGIEGNGLGLYAAKGAIEAQGGKMRFESQENVGTTFFVELPLKLK